VSYALATTRPPRDLYSTVIRIAQTQRTTFYQTGAWRSTGVPHEFEPAIDSARIMQETNS